MHTSPVTQRHLFQHALEEVDELGKLADRIARYGDLLARYGTTAGMFVTDLDPDELAYFLDSTPRQLPIALRRWLCYRAENPTADYHQRELQVRHAWRERYEATAKTTPSDANMSAQFVRRLRAVGLVRGEQVCFGPYDAPSAPLNVFLSWVSTEAIARALSLSARNFQADCRSWLEWHWVHHGFSES